MGQILILLVPLLLLYLRDPPLGTMTIALGYRVLGWTAGTALLVVVLNALAALIIVEWRARRGMGALRFMTLLRRLQALTILGLLALYWVQIQVWYLPEALSAALLPARTPLIGDLLLLLPFVLPFLAIRVGMARAHGLLRGVRPALAEALGGNVRILAVVLLPQLLYLNAYRLLFLSGGPLAEWAGEHPAFAMGSGAFLFFLVFAASPAMVRYLYPRTDMAEIPGLAGLDAQLKELGRRAGLRIVRIIVWRTGSQRVANAAVAGLLRSFQRFFITDYLLGRLSLDEVYAVMAHEIGHAKLRHPLFAYLLAISAGVFLIWTLVALVPILDDMGLAGAGTGSLLIIGLDGIYIFTIFGFFLRRFEHQADMVAVALSGSPEPFTNALKRLGRLNLVTDRRRSLTHPSIRKRLDWLQARLAEAPAETWIRRFRRSNILLVAVILGLYALTLALVEFG